MLRITNKINDELIDIREFANPNACFQTNEYPDNYDFCILHEQFNPYDLFNDNKIKDKEIERLNKIINNNFADICKEQMIDKLSATEMIVLQEKEINRLNNIIKNLDKMFEYYFLGNLKYDQDTINTIYLKYVKLKELQGNDNK